MTNTILGVVDFASGQFEAAREHFERASELFSVSRLRNLGAYLAQTTPTILVATLLILGYPSVALRRFDELLAAARRSSDPNATGIALYGSGLHHVLLRNPRMVAELADEMLAIASKDEVPLINLGGAIFFKGWAMAAAGRGDEGIVEMRRSISDPRIAQLISTSMMILTLAETCGKYGRAEEGLDWVAKGLAAAEQNGQRAFEAELHRVKGELLMLKDPANVVESEHCLRIAVEVARCQSARLFELRATVSLARLLRDTDRRDEARTMFAEIYDWFTEGFDTADLKEAKALLDELGSERP